MKAVYGFSDKEREFFRLIQEAISANPFSERRVDLDNQIAGFFGVIDNQEPLFQAVIEVKQRLAELAQKGRANIKKYTGADKGLLLNAIMFEFFYTYIEEQDQLIERQVSAGKDVVKVDFADAAINSLVEYGIEKKEAIRFFSLSYQLRRAFYFINKSLIGKSRSMQKLRESLWNNVFTSDIRLYEEFLWNRMEDFSTMILGETGTGKGQAAMAIGRSGYIPFDYEKKCFSENFTTSFISINLSQFSEALVESELFGHSKGAFTGAVKDYEGVFSKCSPCGAIFLDEIGDVSHSLQIKLLKVLEEREYTPVGSRESRRFEGRVIAATNKPVNRILKNNEMREDFFYRLCSDLIYMPPLRDRIKEDQSELAELVLFTTKKILGKSSSELTSMITGAIRKSPGINYSWPGNVRELGQSIRRILLTREYKQYSSEQTGGSVVPDDFIKKISSGEFSAARLLKGYCYYLHGNSGTYGDVSRKTGLDRRTVKKYIDEWIEEIE